MSGTRLPRLLGCAIAGALAAGVLAVAPVQAPPVFAADDCAPGNPQYTLDTPPALDILQADKAWARGTGAGVLVAVVDSGIDVANVHLRDAVVGGIDLVGDGTDARGLVDVNGHGTAIAGEIAARRVSDSGVVGLAPAAQLLSVRVFRGDDDESVRAGFGPTADRLAAGIRYAVDAQAQIINVSLSDFGDSPALQASVEYAAASGSLVVASAGNRGTTGNTTDSPRYPAAYPGALAVSATDVNGLVTDDSIHGEHVEISAPGSQILTTATGAGDCYYAQEVPSTSFATAYASGAAALVAAAHPTESPAQWEYRLTATAVRSNPDARDDVNGWGLVQPFDAINLLAGAAVRGPENPSTDATVVGLEPATVTVVPNHEASAFAITRTATFVVLIVALTLLGTIAVVIVLRRRRTVETAAGPTGKGLLGE